MDKIKKIIIVIVILFLISAIWFLKNNSKKQYDEIVQEKLYDEVKEEKPKEQEVIMIKEEEEKLEKEISINSEKNVESKKEETKQTQEIEKIDIKEVEETKKVVPIVEQMEEQKKKEDMEQSLKGEVIDKNDPNFVLVATSLNLENLKSYGLPMLIDFGSEGCMPCRQMKPTLIELNNELRGKAIIKYIDVWEYPEAADGFEFSLIPTQFFINKDGIVYKQHTGILSKEDAINILKEMGME